MLSRGRAGRHHERAEEEAEDKELVADELQQAGEKSWPDHLDEQPTSTTNEQQHAARTAAASPQQLTSAMCSLHLFAPGLLQAC